MAQMQCVLDVGAGEGARDGSPGGSEPQPAAEHVLEHRQPFHQVEFLEDHAHASPRAAHRPAVERRDLGAVEHHRSRVRLDQPVDAPQERRLSRAAQSEDCDDLLGADGNVDAVERSFTRRIGLPQPSDFE